MINQQNHLINHDPIPCTNDLNSTLNHFNFSNSIPIEFSILRSSLSPKNSSIQSKSSSNSPQSFSTNTISHFPKSTISSSIDEIPSPHIDHYFDNRILLPNSSNKQHLHNFSSISQIPNFNQFLSHTSHSFTNHSSLFNASKNKIHFRNQNNHKTLKLQHQNLSLKKVLNNIKFTKNYSCSPQNLSSITYPNLISDHYNLFHHNSQSLKKNFNHTINNIILSNNNNLILRDKILCLSARNPNHPTINHSYDNKYKPVVCNKKKTSNQSDSKKNLYILKYSPKQYYQDNFFSSQVIYPNILPVKAKFLKPDHFDDSIAQVENSKFATNSNNLNGYIIQTNDKIIVLENLIQKAIHGAVYKGRIIEIKSNDQNSMETTYHENDQAINNSYQSDCTNIQVLPKINQYSCQDQIHKRTYPYSSINTTRLLNTVRKKKLTSSSSSDNYIEEKKLKTGSSELLSCRSYNNHNPDDYYNYIKTKYEVESDQTTSYKDISTNKSKQTKQTNNFVAVKIVLLSPNLIARTNHNIDHEEDALGELKYGNLMKGHKNISACQEAYICSNLLFLILPYAEYEDLFELLKKRQKPFSEDEARYFFKQIFHAADFLHSRGLAFRDHSLENILLFSDDSDENIICPKITDPGQAIRIQVNNSGHLLSLSQPSKAFGKSFRPPEVYHNIPYDPIKVDVFCLGWILFYSLTKKQLFERAINDDRRWRLFKSGRIYELLKQKNALHLSDLVIDLISKMLSPYPSQRIFLKQAMRHPWFKAGIHKPIYVHSLYGTECDNKVCHSSDKNPENSKINCKP